MEEKYVDVLDIEFERTRDEAILEATGFTSTEIEDWESPIATGDCSLGPCVVSGSQKVDVNYATGFTLYPDGYPHISISGRFKCPVEVRRAYPNGGTEADEGRFIAAVRAKLGPALSAKYLNL
jgi:hypothetical protein